MKIQFEDSSYIECRRLDNKITFVISAKDYHDPLKKIVNTVELTSTQLAQLISDVK